MNHQDIVSIVNPCDPYHFIPAFGLGRRDYARGEYRNPYCPDSPDAQAWDRGLVAEMLIQRLIENPN
jgi:hypothetical protein